MVKGTQRGGRHDQMQVDGEHRVNAFFLILFYYFRGVRLYFIRVPSYRTGTRIVLV